MGSSKAKKLEKKKDFQKAKLKVGKTKPKAANATDTSFRSKAIVLKDQSLSILAPSHSSQINRQISLLTSTSDVQRKESLNALTKVASIETLPVGILLPQCLPLVTDASSTVREQLIRLLKSLPNTSFVGFEERIVVHLQGGLTNISTEIRNTSLDFLEWAIQTLELNLVNSSGGWYKILRCFLLFFGWAEPKGGSNGLSGSWTGTGYSLERLSKDKKTVSKALEVMEKFLSLGLSDRKDESASLDLLKTYSYSHCELHAISRHPKAFAKLGLFGTTQNEESKRYDTTEDRRLLFDHAFRPQIDAGLVGMRRYGGEVGRHAASIQKVLNESQT